MRLLRGFSDTFVLSRERASDTFWIVFVFWMQLICSDALTIFLAECCNRSSTSLDVNAGNCKRLGMEIPGESSNYIEVRMINSYTMLYSVF